MKIETSEERVREMVDKAKIREEAEEIFRKEFEKAKKYINLKYPHYPPGKREEIARKIARKATNNLIFSKYRLTLTDLEERPPLSLEDLL